MVHFSIRLSLVKCLKNNRMRLQQATNFKAFQRTNLFLVLRLVSQRQNFAIGISWVCKFMPFGNTLDFIIFFLTGNQKMH